MKYPVAMKSIAWARPKNEIKNDEPPFSELLERGLVAKTWYRFWGIDKRAMMDLKEDTATTLAVAACTQAIADAGKKPEDIDLVLTTLPTPLHRDAPGGQYTVFPRLSNRVRDEVGATNALAWDVEMECLSFVLQMQLAVNMIQTGNYKNVLICTTETMSECMDFNTPLSTVFGDASAAAVISAEDNGSTLLASKYMSNGDFYDVATCQWRWPETMEHVPSRGRHDFTMYFTLQPDGRERMVDFVPTTVPQVVKAVVEDSQLNVRDVNTYIFHQPGKTLVELWASGVREAVGDIEGLYPLTLTNNGCLASCAIPTTILMSINDGTIKPGDYVVIGGLGTGWTYSGQLWKWGETKATTILV